MRVTSADATSIVSHTGGEGAPLLVVHGSAADHRDWGAVTPLLRDRFRVHAIDRRGRGASGDGPRYTLDAEAQDVLAVCRALGSPSVFAHSYGALVALEAARAGAPMRALALYEPPIFVDGIEDDLSPRLDRMIAEGDRDGALATFLRDAAGLTDEEIAMMRSDATAWASGLESAHTLAREVRADFAFRFAPERYAHIKVPTLLVLGELSPPFFGEAARAIVAAIPHARLATLPGQAHAAMMMAPDLLVKTVAPHLG